MRNQKEHRLQSWSDRFIDRVVLPPMFTTAIDPAADNMANMGRVAKLKARGAVFGLPDALIAQGDGRSSLQTMAWIEYKRGTGLTARQEATHSSMRAAGFQVYTASSIADVLDALKLAGFRLHENAYNLSVEYEERLDASDVKAASKKAAAPAKKRAATPSAARLAKLRTLGYPV